MVDELSNGCGDLIMASYVLVPYENDAFLGAAKNELIVLSPEHAWIDKPEVKNWYLS